MIRSVGILSKPNKERVRAILPELLAWLRARKLSVLCDEVSAECSGAADQPLAREHLVEQCDLLIVLGGDGTLLAVARLVGDRPVPILPVNVGGLGFLTSVTLEELYPLLEKLLAGQHSVSERMLLDAELIRGGRVVERCRALNDAVLNKAALARMIEFDLSIDGLLVCSYRGDGIIVSTPTGSTAYSLAAGGPIVHPVLAAFVITPICPHTLTNRPLVVPDSVRIEVDFTAGEEPVYLTVDGQVGFELKKRDRIAVFKAKTMLRLVRPPQKTYFKVLRSKLHWGGG